MALPVPTTNSQEFQWWLNAEAVRDRGADWQLYLLVDPRLAHIQLPRQDVPFTGFREAIYYVDGPEKRTLAKSRFLDMADMFIDESGIRVDAFMPAHSQTLIIWRESPIWAMPLFPQGVTNVVAKAALFAVVRALGFRQLRGNLANPGSDQRLINHLRPSQVVALGSWLLHRAWERIKEEGWTTVNRDEVAAREKAEVRRLEEERKKVKASKNAMENKALWLARRRFTDRERDSDESEEDSEKEPGPSKRRCR